MILNHECIGAVGAKALANVLKHCSNLEILDVGGGGDMIGDGGVMALATRWER